MSIPLLQPRALLGIRTNVVHNAYYLSDEEVIYPSGATLILHNYATSRQRYIKLNERSIHMDFLTLSRSKTLCAIIENDARPQVSVYDLVTLKRKRTLTLPGESSAKKIKWIDFTQDERYILCLTGEPDWMMYAFNWERGKIESSTRANYVTNPTGSVSQVICSPVDNANLLFFGPGLFRLMTMQENVWRQFGFQKADHLDITSCCFLGGDRILIGTRDSLLLVVDIGELKFTYDATTVRQINPKAEKDEEKALAAGSATLLPRTPFLESEHRDRSVYSILSFSKGFVYGCLAGTVYFFEKVSPHKYVRRNVFKIDEPDFREVQKEEINLIRHLAVNLSETHLIATTYKCQIYSIKLWGPDYDIAGEIPFQALGHSYHNGPIAGLATCLWKPIFMTCGAVDRTVRVWNYETETIDMIKQYQEDVHCVALHPTGLFAAIGFSDKLRLMTVMIDDLQVMREFPIRECTLTAFSNRGHYLAAVNKNVIQVYSCITFQTFASLRGHNGRITSMTWSSDDKKLISCGTEGAIYEWDMTMYKRVGEVVNKGVSYFATCLTSDAKLLYSVGSDGYIKEISNSNILRILDVNHRDLSTIALSRSDLMMFVCTAKGMILSVKMPLVEPVEYVTFQYHYAKITHVKLSVDDQTLITCSEAGVIGIWKLSFTEGKTVVMDKDFSYFNEILISQLDLEEKLSTIKDLTQRMHELEMEHAYQMRHIETLNNDKIKELHATYSEAVDELKGNIDLLEITHNTELNNINSDINVLKERHEVKMLELEAKYNAELIVEYDKYLTLEEAKDNMIKSFEIKLAELEESKKTTIEELTRVYESKLFNLNKMLEESMAEIEKETRDHEEITREIEDDNDKEIEALRKKYEDMLKFEKENNIRLRGEAGVLKKKYLTSQKEITAIHMEIIFLESEQQKFKVIIRNLEKEVLDLKKEISERDLTIQDKERKIYDLKRRDQELERFKFVLNYKIKELKNQIEPRDKEIREKKEQINDMELELENLQKINIELGFNLSSMREKLAGVYNGVHMFKNKHVNVTKVIKHIKTDIYNVSAHTQDYKALRDGVKKIYMKYITDKDFITARRGEEECQAEFQRQREYLEGVVKVLRRQVEKSREVHYGENLHFMEANWSIMDEIYKIRKELKGAKRKVNDMEALLCFRTSKLYSPRRALQMVHQALKNPEDIENEAREKMNEAKRTRELVREEKDRLTEKFEDLKKSQHDDGKGKRRDIISFAPS